MTLVGGACETKPERLPLGRLNVFGTSWGLHMGGRENRILLRHTRIHQVESARLFQWVKHARKEQGTLPLFVTIPHFGRKIHVDYRSTVAGPQKLKSPLHQPETSQTD